MPETLRLFQPTFFLSSFKCKPLYNVTWSVYIFDPDGNRVALYCDMVSNGFKALQTLGPASKPLGIETGAVVSR